MFADQVRGRLKFVNRLVQIVRFFELYATPESLTGRF